MCDCDRDGISSVSEATGGGVHHAPRETLVLTREQWMLTQPWRQGKSNFGAIVCDPQPGLGDEHGDIEFYGGLCVLESCPPKVMRHILDLHNEAIGYGRTG